MDHKEDWTDWLGRAKLTQETEKEWPEKRNPSGHPKGPQRPSKEAGLDVADGLFSEYRSQW